MVGETPAADAATQEFCDYWENNAVLAGSVLVYNTGRSLGQFVSLLEQKAGALAVPDVLITAVGTKACCYATSRPSFPRETDPSCSHTFHTLTVPHDSYTGIPSLGCNVDVDEKDLALTFPYPFQTYVLSHVEQLKALQSCKEVVDIASIGTLQIFLLGEQAEGRGSAQSSSWREDLQWAKRLDHGWDLIKVREVSM